MRQTLHDGEAEPRPLAPVDEGLQDPGKEVLGEPGARVHEPDPDPFPFPGKLRPHGKPAVAAGVLQNVLHREGQKLGVGQDPPLPLDLEALGLRALPAEGVEVAEVLSSKLSYGNIDLGGNL